MINWKRDRKVDIKRYLPQFLAKDYRFNAINDADSLEHERLRLDINDLIKQLFVETATWGLSEWEYLLGITEVDKDIYNRRAEILTRLNSKASSTPKFLEELANRWIVDKSAKILPRNEEYSFTLYMNKSKCYDLSAVKKAINMYKPAHLGFDINEIDTIGEKIKFSGCIVEVSSITILQGTNYHIKPLANDVKFAGGIFITEDHIIKGVR